MCKAPLCEDGPPYVYVEHQHSLRHSTYRLAPSGCCTRSSLCQWKRAASSSTAKMACVSLGRSRSIEIGCPVDRFPVRLAPGSQSGAASLEFEATLLLLTPKRENKPGKHTLYQAQERPGMIAGKGMIGSMVARQFGLLAHLILI